MIRYLKNLAITLIGLIGWILWCVIIISFGIGFAVIIVSFGIGFAVAIYIVNVFHEVELYKHAKESFCERKQEKGAEK